MGFGGNKNMKIVWICHTTNDEIQKKLNVYKKTKELSPWIFSLSKLLSKKNNLEIHIISPHEYISKYKKFKLNNITYHFFNAHIPLYGRHWPNFFKFDYFTNFFFTNLKIRKIVRSINPDIIQLYGSENAYYSSSILQFLKKYPVLVTIQGFISLSSNYSYLTKKRISIEKKIFEKFKHFGIRTKTMELQILEKKPNAILHWHGFPQNVIPPLNIPINEKKYDCVFFARITKDKGIEDLLKAISRIKIWKRDISLNVIGNYQNDSYKKYLLDMCENLDIIKNVTWTGFLPSQLDVHTKVSYSKISILPTYHEIISGTIIESLFLKIPVVAYDVGSIHELNKDFNVVKLIEKGNIDCLANQIYKLIIDNKEINRLAEIGFKVISQRYNDEQIMKETILAYQEVIDDFNN